MRSERTDGGKHETVVNWPVETVSHGLLTTAYTVIIAQCPLSTFVHQCVQQSRKQLLLYPNAEIRFYFLFLFHQTKMEAYRKRLNLRKQAIFIVAIPCIACFNRVDTVYTSNETATVT